MSSTRRDFTLAVSAATWSRLHGHLVGSEAERMAFGYCSASSNRDKVRLQLHEVELPMDQEYAEQYSARVVLSAKDTIPYLIGDDGRGAVREQGAERLDGAGGIACDGQRAAGERDDERGGERTDGDVHADGGIAVRSADAGVPGTTAQDTVGNAVNNYQASFTMASNPATTAPAVVSQPPYYVSSVPTNAIVEIGYNEPINPATLTGNSVFVRVANTGTNVSATLALDTTGTVIRVTPSAALAANTQYCYYVQSGVQGTNGDCRLKTDD